MKITDFIEISDIEDILTIEDIECIKCVRNISYYIGLDNKLSNFINKKIASTFSNLINQSEFVELARELIKQFKAKYPHEYNTFVNKDIEYITALIECANK